MRPRAFICWLQFISSHDTAADLIACTFCCHLKGISCHAPNWCTCLQPRTLFCAAQSQRTCEQHTTYNFTPQHTDLHSNSRLQLYIWKVCFMWSSADLIWLSPKECSNPLILKRPRGSPSAQYSCFSSSVEYGNKHVVFIWLFGIFSARISCDSQEEVL